LILQNGCLLCGDSGIILIPESGLAAPQGDWICLNKFSIQKTSVIFSMAQSH
jgi:hypothetical protein